MEVKKSPKANLENYSRIFIQLGLVLALLVSYLALESKTYETKYGDVVSIANQHEDEDDVPEIIEQEIVQPEQKAPPPPTPDKIEIVEDEKEVEETVIETTETDETEKIEVEEIEEVEEVEEIIEDVAFRVIEDVPVFPGCKGSKAQLKKCFEEKVRKHLGRKFDADIANEIGLDSGKKVRIRYQFKISKTGDISNIRIAAPHKRLKKEGMRVISSLPHMKPGKQRGRPVNVPYTGSIVLQVE